MKATMINRSWPAEEDADAGAVQWEVEVELNRTQAARDLQRSLHALEDTAELGDLVAGAHERLILAIPALREAVRDQWQAVQT